jgi:putative spermidine/putrescine transport system ATP-binding protein
MNGGLAEQIGTPLDIYSRPRSRFVASFVGTMKTLEAVVVVGASGRITINGVPGALPLAIGTAVDIGFNPGDLMQLDA